VDQESVARMVKGFQEKQGAQDSWFFQPTIKSTQQRMLLVHQTAQQKAMLLKYGETIFGMDATYKTTQWGFPLFLLNVVTNHGRGHPVAIFFVEEETTIMITEALRM
jgi:hypothetical protein